MQDIFSVFICRLFNHSFWEVNALQLGNLDFCICALL